jgi:hypothetical protein
MLRVRMEREAIDGTFMGIGDFFVSRVCLTCQALGTEFQPEGAYVLDIAARNATPGSHGMCAFLIDSDEWRRNTNGQPLARGYGSTQASQTHARGRIQMAPR